MTDQHIHQSDTRDSTTGKPLSIPLPAAILGFAGLIPFIVPAAALWLLSSQYQFEMATALVAYGAVILSFLGGIRWGLCVHPDSQRITWTELNASVLPSLAGWTALLLHWLVNQPIAIILLIFGFLLQYYWDRQAMHNGRINPWFARLRFYLSCGATLALLAALVRLMTT